MIEETKKRLRPQPRPNIEIPELSLSPAAMSFLGSLGSLESLGTILSEMSDDTPESRLKPSSI